MSRSRVPIWFGLVLGVLGIFWLFRSITSPETPQTTFYPLSEFARSTHGVYGFTNMLMLAIFIGIEGWLIYTLFRFSRRPAGEGSDPPPQTHGHTVGEVSFTAATALLVIVLYVPSCQQIAFTQGSVPEGAMTIEVTGRQWWWDIYYPDYDLVVANELHVPVDRTVNLLFKSSDVIHSFWVPRLGGKRDLVPGRDQNVWFTAEEVGVFDGQCAEFCGTSHANMAFQVVVDSPEDFEAWVAGQKAPPAHATDPLAAEGQMAFLATGGCVTCHTTFQNDKSVYGMQGPNLAKVATRRMIASGTLDNTPENLFRWIQNPHAIKPGVLMNVVNPSTTQCEAPGVPDACCTGPQTGNCLSDEVIEQLVAYLASRT